MSGHAVMTKGLLVLCLLFATDAASTEEQDPRFMGYYINQDSTEPMMAPSSDHSKFTTSGTVAGPCPTTDPVCRIDVGCQDGTLIGPNSSRRPCCCGGVCQTLTIYQTSPFGGPSAKHFFCAANWAAYTLYRELPEPTTTSSAVSTTMGTTLSAQIITMSESPPQRTSAADSGESGSGSAVSSSAWIAGPVLGGLIVLGLLAGGMFWWGKRSRRLGRVEAGEAGNRQAASIDKPQFPPGASWTHAAAPVSYGNYTRPSTAAELGAFSGIHQPDSQSHAPVALQEMPASGNRF